MARLCFRDGQIIRIYRRRLQQPTSNASEAGDRLAEFLERFAEKAHGAV